MSRYVNLDEATDLFRGIDATMTGSFVADTLESLSTIDTVECEECKWRDVCSQVVPNIERTVDTMLRWCSDGERISGKKKEG